MVRSYESQETHENGMMLSDKILDVEEIDTDIADEVDIVDSGEGELSPPSHTEWSHQSNNNINGAGGRYSASANVSPNGNGMLDPDRRLRRQIANCNERRRMQSINAGFQSLRNLLPRKEGEKLSKAAILQQTADLIHNLKSDLNRLLDDRDCTVTKRRRLSDDVSCEETRQVIEQLQAALERERNLRVLYETQLTTHLPYNTTAAASSAHPQNLLAPAEDMKPQVPRQYEVQEEIQSNLLSVPTLAPLPLLSLATNNPLGNTMSPDATVSVIRSTPATPGNCDPLMSHIRSSAPSLNGSPTVSSTTSLGFPPLHSTFTVMATATNSPSPPEQPTPPTSATFNTHRSLNVILDAIRHLEGSTFQSTPPQTPTSHANLLVR